MQRSNSYVKLKYEIRFNYKIVELAVDYYWIEIYFRTSFCDQIF